MWHIKYQILFAFLFVLTLSTCATSSRIESASLPKPESTSTKDAGSKAPTLPTQEPQKDSTQMPQPVRTLPAAGLENLIEKSKEDLARRLSISVTQIKLEKAENVVWSNASLGCPQPGMVYAEVLTPGYLILLVANNQVYEYHTSKGTEVIYCVNPSPPVPGIPGDI